MGLSSSKAAQSSKQPEGAAAGAAVAAAANADSCCGAGGGCSASATAHGTAHGSSEGAACPRMPAAGATGAAADDCVTPLVPRISSSTSGGARRSALRSPEVSGGGLTRKSYSTEGEAARVRFSEDTSEHTTGERPRTGDLASSDSVSLKKIVDVFYDKVMADPQLSPFFSNVNVEKLKSHQVKFMALAFGGKELVFEEHPELNLRRIHWRLIRDRGLTEAHWELFFQRFQDALSEMPEIPDATKATAVASVATTRMYFRPVTDEEVASGAYAKPQQEALGPQVLAL